MEKKLCFHCGSDLGEKDICSKCKREVHFYKEVDGISKALYNQGLAKAKIRDLSGAIHELHRSLQYDKSNIDARNLLGLVYYEIGDVVEALKHWIISKSLKSDKNLAIEYIAFVQDNQSKLEKVNSAIKKYNLSLNYAKQNSPDMAIIQLKSVVSLNPRFVKAYLLLALCYIKENQTEKAKETLYKVLHIDRNNRGAVAFLSQMNQYPEQSLKKEMPQSDKLAIVEKLRPYHSMILGIGGFIVGGIIVAAIVLPLTLVPKMNKIETLSTTIENNQSEYKNSLDLISSQLNETKMALDASQSKVRDYEAKSGHYQLLETLNSAYGLMEQNEYTQAADLLIVIDEATISDESLHQMYNVLKTKAFHALFTEHYKTGIAAYLAEKDESALESFLIAQKYNLGDQDTSDDCYYYLARTQMKLGNNEDAKVNLIYLIDNYPNSNRIGNAKSYLKNL